MVTAYLLGCIIVVVSVLVFGFLTMLVRMNEAIRVLNALIKMVNEEFTIVWEAFKHIEKEVSK